MSAPARQLERTESGAERRPEQREQVTGPSPRVDSSTQAGDRITLDSATQADGQLDEEYACWAQSRRPNSIADGVAAVRPSESLDSSVDHSMVLIDRRSKSGVVVLSNTATAEVDRLAEDLIRLLAGSDIKPRAFDKEQ